MAKAERTARGQFAEGNPGGPGRPRRATERAYLAALSDACPPETWREIVARAVADAKDGDAKARSWLAAYLVGQPDSMAATLHALAVDEALGADPVAESITRRRLDGFDLPNTLSDRKLSPKAWVDKHLQELS
jgi:hypothetical protein